MGIIPVLPFSYSEEIICPVGEVETIRVTNPNPVCIDHSTAKRWMQLGIAEIIGEPVQKPVKMIEESVKIENESAEPIPKQEETTDKGIDYEKIGRAS